MTYSKTSLGTDQISGFSLSRRGRRIAIVIAGVVVAATAGLGTWSAVTADSWGKSTSSCVNVTVPGSIGGEVLHNCGTQAASFCRTAYAGTVQGSADLTRNARSQCALAGFTRAKVGPGQPG